MTNRAHEGLTLITHVPSATHMDIIFMISYRSFIIDTLYTQSTSQSHPTFTLYYYDVHVNLYTRG